MARRRIYLHPIRSVVGSIGSLLPRLAVLGILVAAAAGCQIQTPTATNIPSLEARADSLLQSDPNEAISVYRQMAQTALQPEEKARAQLGIARAYLILGNYHQALDSLYAARTQCNLGPLRETADHLLAEASFLNGDWSIARGHLEHSLASARGTERSIILAKLHVCAKKSCDLKAADRYLAEIPKPYGNDVREILRATLEPPRPPRPTGSPAIVNPVVPPPAPPPVPPAGPTRIIPRTYWGARPVLISRIDPMGKITRLTVHHTGGPTFWGHSASETAYEIRKIQRVHQNEKHWADIGYHFIIDRVGRTWQGRPLSYQGAHAHGVANRGNIGIVVLGNYMQQEMNIDQIRTLRTLVARLCDEYGIPANRIYTHGEIRGGTTDCPGPAVTRVVQALRRDMGVRHAD
jgi:hypothetical protein